MSQAEQILNNGIRRDDSNVITKKSLSKTFESNLIYVFEIKNESHEGLLKIGETRIILDKNITEYPVNCLALNEKAKARIDQYTKTAGVEYQLRHTQLAIRQDDEKGLVSFHDHDVHNVLKRSGFQLVHPGDKNCKEWFRVSLEQAKAAIQAVIDGEKSINAATGEEISAIIFRKEQEEAIKMACDRFKTVNRVLWNAKMRFGKTLCALETIRRMEVARSIIITHRPAVSEGWFEESQKIFAGDDRYVFCSKDKGEDFNQVKDASDKRIIYFASIQDLRGSEQTGGKFDKNNDIFNTEWDLLVIDEAHEGTQTELGARLRECLITKDKTKTLELSGTPFNLMESYAPEDVFTWDYSAEQQAKQDWDNKYPLDPNPYADLPEMRILVYDLGKIISNPEYIEIVNKAFDFSEFFRTWTEIDAKNNKIPKNAQIGDFCHEDDVKRFLDLLTTDNPECLYPFATEEFRDMFRHTFWLLPGVKEAKALEKLLKNHPVFSMFRVVNVAGDGSEDEGIEDNGLTNVHNAIKAAGEDQYTITLSCGRLTTGVTVEEWTAVFYLAGSYETSAAQYMQAIFRVQSPCRRYGKIKTHCYTFDFAPDRTLKIFADTAIFSADVNGQKDKSDGEKVNKFTNFCPVIACDGSTMREIDSTSMLRHVKRALAERAINSGFADNNIYDRNVLKQKFTEKDIENFNSLKAAAGTQAMPPRYRDLVLNDTGLTGAEQQPTGKTKGKSRREQDPEEKERKKQIKDALAILRAVSIRIPLLLYGVDVPFEQDVGFDDFINAVDNESWEDFMPPGITKEWFKTNFGKYYDNEKFMEASHIIRGECKIADRKIPEERIAIIINRFNHFQNPDKETVLTPWRVVNMHMSDCLGGYDFYDEQHKEELPEPRFVDQGAVTQDVSCNPDAHILELNSKSGLYPLWAAYNIYRAKCEINPGVKGDYELSTILWEDVIRDNIFVICKTKMARTITRRTLAGYHTDWKVNSEYMEKLIPMLYSDNKKFSETINLWTTGKKYTSMNFDAIIGNPPYQISDNGAGVSAKPLYHIFVQNAVKMNPRYLSMIIPARWFAGGKGLDDFRKQMLEDHRICKLVDYPATNEVFKSVDIAGGICYFLWAQSHNGQCEMVNVANGERNSQFRGLDEYGILIRNNISVAILRKVRAIHGKGKYLSERVSPRKPFTLPTNYKPTKRGIPCWFIQKIGLKCANPNAVQDANGYLNKWKLLVPKAPIAGQTDFTKPLRFYYSGNIRIAKPGEVCTESWIVAGAFDSEEETLSYQSYLFTKIAQFLLLQAVISQDVTREKFCFVPDLGTYEGTYSDVQLCKRWDISPEEMSFIDSKIKNSD